MRRIILTAVASTALAVPGVALASRHDEQHRHELRRGTVASFAGGKLAIALNDGTTVSATVTEGTEIECHTAIAADARDGGHEFSDDRGDRGQSNSGPGGGREGNNRPGDGRPGDGRDEDGRDDEAEDQAERCSTTALVAGAAVREAELSVSGTGAIWRKIELSH